MKRKDLEDINDDVSFISLSSPSRKSRRLDVDLLEQELSQEQQPFTSISSMVQIDGPAVDSMPSGNCSEERAIVLYNPANNLFFKSPSSPDFSIIVNTDLVSGLKDHIRSLGNTKWVKPEEYEESTEKSSEVSNDCLAVVPWVAPHLPLASASKGPEAGPSEPMETEDAEMMDTDDNCDRNSDQRAFDFGGIEGAGGGPQHSMKPHLLQNTSTPVTW